MHKSILIAGFILVGTSTWAQDTPKVLPTPLEEFATRADARVVFAQESASMVSGKTSLTITAVVIESGEERMKGLRFDLVAAYIDEQVYLDEEWADRVLEDVRSLIRSLRGMHKNYLDEDPTQQRILGTGSEWCLRPKRFIHVLCPEYFKRPDSEGTYIRVPIARGFRLAGHQPEELEAAIIDAMKILDSME